MLSPKVVALLEDYVAGRLTAEAKKELYSLLGGKPEKNEEAKIYIDLYAGLSGLELDDLRSDMKMWEKKYTNKSVQATKTKKIKLLPAYRKYAAAAAIVLMSVAAYWATQTKDTAESIFADNFSVNHVILLNTSRGGANKGGTNSKQLAFVLLQSKHFAKAAESFGTLLEGAVEHEDKGELLLGFSLALIGEGRYNKAYDSLLSLDAMKAEALQEYTDWYLALVCLKLNKLADAKRLFNTIKKKPSHLFYIEATDILGKI